MEVFFECLLWCEKWIRTFGAKTILKEKRVSRSEIWIDGFSRVEKLTKSSAVFGVIFIIGSFLKIRFILHKSIFFGKG